MPLYPFINPPVLIDPVYSSATKGVIAGNSGSSGFPSSGPVLYNGALYFILVQEASPAFAPFAIQAYKSTDQGATWTILDAAHSPTCNDPGTSAGGFTYDGAHTLIAAYMPTGGADRGVAGNIQLQNFDLNTETWGAVYGNAGNPAAYEVNQCFVRPDGSIVVLYGRSLSGGLAVNLSAGVFASGAWTTYSVDSNLSGGFVSNGYCAACMDPATGNIGIFATARVPFSVHEAYFQLFKSDNTVPIGAFSVLASDPNIIQECQPVIAGGQWVGAVYNPTSRTTQLVVGTPLTAPVWTSYAQATIDPTAPAWVYSRNFAFAVDGTGIYGSYIGYDGTQAVIRLIYNSNVANLGSAWTGLTAFTSTDGKFFFNGTIWLDFFYVSRVSGNTFGTGAALSDPAGSTTSQYWFGAFAPTVTLGCGTCNNAGEVGTPYSCQLQASSGTPAYTFAIIAGALPPGLSLNTSTGVISGTPLSGGSFGYTAQVTDSLGATATANCSISVSGAVSLICGTCDTPATVGTAYSCAVTVTGGTPPYSFEVIGGSLPPGLTLDPTYGVISGTPTTAGIYGFTIRVTDSVGAIADCTCGIVVSPPPCTDPLSGEGLEQVQPSIQPTG